MLCARSLSLIVIVGNDLADDCHLNRLLENVWNAMLLLFGQEELTNIKNLERFKREIKVRGILWRRTGLPAG